MGKGKAKGKAQQKKATNNKPATAAGVATNAKGNEGKDDVDDVVEEDNGPETSEANPDEPDNGAERAPDAADTRPEPVDPPTAAPHGQSAPATVPSGEAADERIASLQALVDSLTREKEDATRREESQRGAIASLRQQLDTAHAALDQAKAHNASLQEQVAVLKAAAAESQAESKALRAQVAQLTAATEALSVELQQARDASTAALDDSIAACDVPVHERAATHRTREEEQRPAVAAAAANDSDGFASVNVYATIPEETSADTAADDSAKESTTETAAAADEGFANFDDDDAATTPPPPPTAAHDDAEPVPPAAAAAITPQDDDTSDDWARRRISIGIVAQLLPETSPFAPQQFVKAEAQVASLVRMPLTQFAQSLLRGMESKELCHPTKTKTHVTFVDKTFVFSTVDVVATGSTTWTRGGGSGGSGTATAAWSATSTSSLLYRKMIRLKKSVYYNGDRVVTIDHSDATAGSTTVEDPADWTVSDFFGDDVPWNDDDVAAALAAGKKPKQPLILVAQLPGLPTAVASSVGGGSEVNGSQDDEGPPGFLDVTYVDYDDFPSALSFPCRLVLPSSAAAAAAAAAAALGSLEGGAPHGVSSGRAPAPRPGVFKQISQSFSFSFNKSASQGAAVAPATTAAAMDTSGSSHHTHGADHVDCVLQRLSRNLATATAVPVHGNDVAASTATTGRKKTTAAATSFPLAPDMFTLDYYAATDDDAAATAAAVVGEETALPPATATRVVARVVPVFAWPGDQKDAFHKTLTQTRMIFDVAEGKYISPEDVLRRHHYSLVVHK